MRFSSPPIVASLLSRLCIVSLWSFASLRYLTPCSGLTAKSVLMTSLRNAVLTRSWLKTRRSGPVSTAA